LKTSFRNTARASDIYSATSDAQPSVLWGQ
jgi:hypothetical protein